MIGAPFFHVEFADFWLADQLNSLAVVFLDLQFLGCFYYTNNNWITAGGKTLIGSVVNVLAFHLISSFI